MTNLNGVNSVGIGLNTNLPQREAQPEVKQEVVDTLQQPTAEPNFIPGDDVLNAMTQHATINKSVISGVHAYDVAKYVTPEQAKRIAGFVAGFEDVVAQNLQNVNNEFGATLSEAAKMNIALAAAEKQAV